MRISLRQVCVVALLLPLAGCTPPWHKKPSATPPPQAQAPVETAPETVAPPEAKPAPEPAPAAAAPAAETAPKPATTLHRHKAKPSPATPEGAQQPSSTQVASNAAAPAEASAIGQLSEGDASTSGARNETASLIQTTDARLRSINRTLTAQELKTAAQVRKFLQQARDALRNQNVDAAHTLAVKAKLLLDELTK